MNTSQTAQNLIKCRRTDNNGQPIKTEQSKNVIGKWTLGDKQPDINGLHLSETCELNELVRCNTFYAKNKIERNLPCGTIATAMQKTN